MSDSSTAYTPAQLDAMTGGAFTAPTSGERAARLREWLATEPAAEQMQAVFKELSAKDKGAAKLLREKLDDIKRAKNQESMAAEWAQKGEKLLAGSKIHIADALAWQRDAAKAGAPLSREPLASIKTQLADRVKLVEDLQYQAQVQREAALMLAQRVEVLSTKPLADAVAVEADLAKDMQDWQQQLLALQAHAQWSSVDVKFPAQLESARAQVQLVWEAFSAALAQAKAAKESADAPLPQVPVWAEELRTERMAASGEADRADKPAKAKVDPEQRKAAVAAVREVLSKLETELAEGHGKASVAAANAVRAALREHGSLLDAKTDFEAHNALGAAAELEGWQRWRANQIREELIKKAQLLVVEPLSGRKQQEAIRQLREQWKQTDQGGMANNALWKQFDEACNTAHKPVEEWVAKVKAEEAAHKTQREALIAQVTQWTQDNAARTDWKAITRELHGFAEQWRNGGHVSEKLFDQLQPQWKSAIKAAHATLEAAQKDSIARRHAMIAEAQEVAAQPQLRIDAVKSLQQRWQQEAQAVPLERKLEQKLWDAFRKPIDEAFNRKSEAREKAQAAVSAHDAAVLAAVAALDAANASGDAQKIKAAMTALEAAVRNQPAPAEQPAAASAPALAAPETAPATDGPGADGAAADSPATADTATEASTVAQQNEAAPGGSAEVESDAAAAAASDAGDEATAAAQSDASETAPVPDPAPSSAPAPAAPKKPLVAVRGDDRPGAKKTEPAGRADGRGGKFGSRDDKGRAPRGDKPAGARDAREGARNDARGQGRFESRFAERTGPRLSNQAFYAQRDALERAQAALKKLSMQAHGESLVKLVGSWQQRDAAQLPTVQELGKALTPAVRSKWASALGQSGQGDAAAALLRLEIAADSPTPAEHMSARRALQLQLLTQRGSLPPAQTWGDDVATVLGSAHDESSARRLQGVLGKLLRK